MHGPRWWRAAAFGAATAVTAAYTAALTKAITSYTKEGWGHVFTHFQPYMLAVTGIGHGVPDPERPARRDRSPPRGPPW